MPTISGTLTFQPDLIRGGDWDYRDPRCALSQRGSPVWTECASRGPSLHAEGRFTLAWDGRLDCRDDLLLRLGEHHLSDDDIVLRAYERWSVAGLEPLVGEWSLALRDRQRGVIHLARDYMGARPLYYCLDDRAVSWSSDLGELVVRCGRVDALSDAFAAHFMSAHAAPGLTPYETVHVVPAGACVTISEAGAVTSRRLWTLTTNEIRYAYPRRYEEELRRLWQDAVKTRLRTRAAVWAELSGGLDSSSVVCMADRLIRRGDAPARCLRLISHATLRSPEGDERRFISDVERQVGVSTEIVGVEDSQALTDASHAWLTPYAVHGVGFETVRRVSAQDGRVILSGRLGDAVMGCLPDNSESVFDDLAALRFVNAARNLHAWSRATRKPFIELAWRLFVPERRLPESAVDLLSPSLRTMLADAPVVRTDDVGRRSNRTLRRLVLEYALGNRLDFPYRSPDIVYAYPFAHRPLVEFVLAIPGEELSAPGIHRALMRRAFGGFLPPRIANRTSKGYYPPAAFRRLRQEAESIADVGELHVVRRGWIDAPRLREALRTLTDGGGATGGDLLRVLRLEQWLRARQHAPAIPHRKEVNSHAVLSA